MEARVGTLDVSPTARFEQISVNQVCGAVLSYGNDGVYTYEYKCSAPLLGQYISLQSKASGEHFSVVEVVVYITLGLGEYCL